MKYYWDEKDLIEDYKLLEKIYIYEKDPERKQELSSYLELVMDKICQFAPQHQLNYCESLESIPYLDILLGDVASYEKYYPLIKNIDKKIYLDTSSEILVDRANPLSIDDMIELVNAFFRQTNSEFYTLFLKNYKNRYSNIKESKINGADAMMFHIPVLDKNYIVIKRNLKKNRKLLTLLHEEGHAAAALLNPHRYLYGSILTEVEALLFEMLGADYFGKELDDSYFLKSQIVNLEYYKTIAMEIIDEKLLADLCNNDLNEETLNNLIYKNNLSHLLYNDIPITTLYMKYLISYLVAIELYEVYQNDKDLALNMLKKIVMQKKDEDDYEKITNLVTPTSSLESYQKRLMRKKNLLNKAK